jgi:DNA-binding transcriptional ArsR family regulator
MSLDSSKLKGSEWQLLGVFQSEVRVEILKMLIKLEYRSLSEIARALEERGHKMTLSGVLKHMKELEKAGLVRSETGIFGETPDARKTIYFLEGRERVEQVLRCLEIDVIGRLRAGMIFDETAKIARRVQGMNRPSVQDGKARLGYLLAGCASGKVYPYLTEDEKKKLGLWKLVLSAL